MVTINRAQLKFEAKQALRPYRNEFYLAFFLMIFVSFVLNAVIDRLGYDFLSLLITFALSLVMSVLNFGFSKMALRRMRGEAIELGDIADVLPHWLGIIILSLVVSFIVGLGYILLVIPGIIAVILLSQTTFIFLDDPKKDTMTIVRESYEMMKNYMMEYFLLSLSFLGWAILGIFTLGILYIWLVPYMTLTLANFYLVITGQKNEYVQVGTVSAEAPAEPSAPVYATPVGASGEIQAEAASPVAEEAVVEEASAEVEAAAEEEVPAEAEVEAVAEEAPAEAEAEVEEVVEVVVEEEVEVVIEEVIEDEEA